MTSIALCRKGGGQRELRTISKVKGHTMGTHLAQGPHKGRVRDKTRGLPVLSG